MDPKSATEQVTIAKNTQPITQEESFESSKGEHHLTLASILPVSAQPSSE